MQLVWVSLGNHELLGHTPDLKMPHSRDRSSSSTSPASETARRSRRAVHLLKLTTRKYIVQSYLTLEAQIYRFLLEDCLCICPESAGVVALPGIYYRIALLLKRRQTIVCSGHRGPWQARLVSISLSGHYSHKSMSQWQAVLPSASSPRRRARQYRRYRESGCCFLTGDIFSRVV